MPRTSHALATLITVSLATITVSACGNGGGSTAGAGSSSRAGGCPPEQKGEGIAVTSRWDIEDLMRAQNWQEDIPPYSCAGPLARYIPEFPDSYGLAPNSEPYIMNDTHVFLRVAELPDELTSEYGGANIPAGHPILGLEISRYSPDEMATTRDWLDENKENYLTRTVAGEEVYLLGAIVLARPDGRERLGGGLVAFLDDNVVVKLSHPELYRPNTPVLEPGGVVYETMAGILETAG